LAIELQIITQNNFNGTKRGNRKGRISAPWRLATGFRENQALQSWSHLKPASLACLHDFLAAHEIRRSSQSFAWIPAKSVRE
jgi:hypothetical protein